MERCGLVDERTRVEIEVCRTGLMVPVRRFARLELQRGSQSENGGILEGLAWKSSRRSCRTAARMDDVLKVRLHRPSVADLVLVDRREQSFERALRPIGAHEVAIVVIQLLGAQR